MEFLRLGIIYIHLIACCVAIGLILTSDLRMIKQLFTNEETVHANAAHIDSLKYAVTNALTVLWVTGMAIIALDASVKGLDYFSNPKLQAKIGIVVLLTINGFFLHAAVLPLIKKTESLLNLKTNQRILTIFAGTVSGVSWFYAALLGVGKPLAWKYTVVELVAAYSALIAGGFGVMLLLTHFAKQLRDKPSAEFVNA